MAKYGVFAIKMWGLDKAEEELGSVGVWSGIGHRENSSSSVLVGEVFVLELRAVDALTSSSVSDSEITTLCHESLDDSVEDTSLEVEWLSGLSLSLFTSAECSEVLRGFWSVSCELDGDSASGLTTDGDVEENS